jgi:hypothetical protein
MFDRYQLYHWQYNSIHHFVPFTLTLKAATTDAIILDCRLYNTMTKIIKNSTYLCELNSMIIME